MTSLVVQSAPLSDLIVGTQWVTGRARNSTSKSWLTICCYNHTRYIFSQSLITFEQEFDSYFSSCAADENLIISSACEIMQKQLLSSRDKRLC